MPFKVTPEAVAAAIITADTLGKNINQINRGVNMKKIINRPETVVMEMCNGIAMAHPELEFVRKYKVMKKRI